MAEEKNLENRVKAFLKQQGCWFIKYWGGGGFTKSGVPDILCCCDGHFLGIELKASNGRPSDLQIHNLKKIMDAQGTAILLYPKDFEQFKGFIQAVNAGLEPDDLIDGGTYPFLTEWWDKYL